MTWLFSHHRLNTTALYGGAVIIAIITLIEFLLNMRLSNDIFVMASHMSLAFLYAVVIDGYILQPIFILKSKVKKPLYDGLSFKSLAALHIVVLGTLLTAMQLSVGIGAFIDIPSMLFIGVPLLATLFLVKEHYHRMLLFKNYIFYTFYIVIFLYINISLLIRDDLYAVGPTMAILVLSAMFCMYFYLFLVRPMKMRYSIKVGQDEKLFFSSMVMPLVVTIMVLSSYMTFSDKDVESNPLNFTNIEVSTVEKGRLVATLTADVSVELEEQTDMAMEELERKRVLLKSTLIETLSEYTFSEYKKNPDMMELRNKLISKLNSQLNEAKIVMIYFRGFVFTPVKK